MTVNMHLHANKSACRYGDQLTVSQYRPGVEIQSEFDRGFLRQLVAALFDQALPIVAGLRRERCLNLFGRRSLHVRRLRTRYGYDTQHMHAHIEVALVLQGACRFLIQDRVYPCQAGDVIFVPPYQPHVDAYSRADAGYGLLWFLLYEAHYAVSWTGFAPAAAGQPLRYFYRKRIVTIPMGGAPAWSALRQDQAFDLDTLRELLLYLCYRTVMVLRRAPAEHSSRVLASALARIRQDYHRPLSVGGLAAELGITPNYLSALFTRTLGISFKHYLHEVRLGQAQSLLKNPALSIKEIIAACGFGSNASFDRIFRQVYGMSPTVYRDSVQRAGGEIRGSRPPARQGPGRRV